MAFNITALTDAFKNQLEGGEFYNRVGQGTMAEFFQSYDVTNKGTQQLNVNNANLTWDIDVDGDIDAYDDANSSLVFGKRDLTVDGNAAKGYVLNRDLYGSYASVGATGHDDESVANRFVGQMLEKTSYEYAKRLYTGFGLGTPTNGLSNANIGGTTIDITGGTAFLATNAIAKIAELIEDFLAVTGNDALENSSDIAIIVKPSDYRKIRAAYRVENYFNTDLVSESGMMISKWLDDERISIYGDPAYTGEAMIVAADSVYVGKPNLTFLDDVEFWYNPDKKAIGFSVEIWGGTQILEAGHARTANHVA